MAEAIAAIGVVASVAQLADYGFKLSIKLFAYSEAVYKADKTIKSFSNEVSLTSAVLRELASIFDSKESRFVSGRATEATVATVKECFDVFNQLNAILEKSMGSSSGAAKESDDSTAIGGKMSTFERLKWPFMQPKVDLLRSNLDRMKTSLTLMLQVLSFARDMAKQTTADSTVAMQKLMIENLAKSEIEATNRYNQLLKLLEHQPVPTLSPATIDDSRDIIDTGREPPPPYINATTLPVHSNALQTMGDVPSLAKLPICLELIADVLEQLTKQGLVANRDAGGSGLRYLTHTQLKRTIASAKEREARQLSTLLGPSSERIFIKALQDRAVLSNTLNQLASQYNRLIDSTSQQQAPTSATSSSGQARSSRVSQLQESFEQLAAEFESQSSPLTSEPLASLDSRPLKSTHTASADHEAPNTDPALRAAILKRLKEQFADRNADSDESALPPSPQGSSVGQGGSGSLRSSKPTWSKRRPGGLALTSEEDTVLERKASELTLVSSERRGSRRSRKTDGASESSYSGRGAFLGGYDDGGESEIGKSAPGELEAAILAELNSPDEVDDAGAKLVAESRLVHGFLVDDEDEDDEGERVINRADSVHIDDSDMGEEGIDITDKAKQDGSSMAAPKLAHASTFGLSLGDGSFADKLLAEWTTVSTASVDV